MMSRTCEEGHTLPLYNRPFAFVIPGLTRNLMMSLHFEEGAEVFDVITVFVIVALFGSKVCPCPRFRFIMRFRVVARNDRGKGLVLW